MSIELIRNKQRELAAAKAAAEKLAKEREQAGIDGFAATEILNIWEQIKHLKVPDWRGSGSREHNDNRPLVPLEAHAIQVTPTSLYLTDWDGAIKVAWYVTVTDKGAVRFVVGGRARICGDYYKAEDLRDHFVDYMAKMLPSLEEDTNAKV
jgi:hypothetical protein